MRRDGEAVEYHAGTLNLTLWAAETEAYIDNLSDRVPSIYVVMHPGAQVGDEPDLVLATVSPYEGQDYADNGEELVEKVPMSEGLVACVRDYTLDHHEHEEFIKRRRDNKRVELSEDGRGDSRISQLSDVYWGPDTRKRRSAVQ